MRDSKDHPPTSSRFNPHPERKLGVKALKAFDVVLCRCYHRFTVQSPLQLPKTGPAILISNHTSGLDPFLLQSVSRRVIVWMMAKEYYEIPGLKKMFQMLEAIPVDRASRDTAAVRLALRALQDGRVVGIFPEGRISTQRGQILPFQPGVTQMAIKTGAPVCPAFVDGTNTASPTWRPRFFTDRKRASASVRLFPLIAARLPRQSLDAATQTLQRAVLDLKPLQHR